ncbi:MAG: hypothetical protein SPF56_04300 [Bacteroidaceae bacterium]|nr:hypothetical protein [Prevotellaceae bacterium]MDY5631707.1 hypothetical protein [Bacteroidaceae bacterium]
MKKLLYILATIAVALSMGMLSACSEDNDGYITASEDDFPQILLPWFGDWKNGEPAVYKTFARDVAFVDSATVTPALHTTVTWRVDGEQIHEGKKINHTFLAGNYVLELVATTTKGKTTSRKGKLVVQALATDPTPGNDIKDRQVVPGQNAKLHGQNMDQVTMITINGVEIPVTFVENGDKSYVKYVVPATLPLGAYRITLTDAAGNVYGGDMITISNEPPTSTEETLWEGSFDVTWGTPFDLLKEQFKNLVVPGNTVRAYVSGDGQGAMTTAWWNNILTGLGDPNRGDIMISGDAVLEYTLTDLSLELMNAQDGALFVGNGYTINKITKE